jgi:cytoskeletal protein RodZ
MNKKIGEILRDKRLEMMLDIPTVSRNIKIKKRDIEAMEEDNWGALTRHIYLIGAIKSYSSFLKIDHLLIEEKTKQIPIQENVKNKKHLLLNVGSDVNLTPSKDMFFNFFVIAVLFFLAVSCFFSLKSSRFISSDDLIYQMQNTNSTLK